MERVLVAGVGMTPFGRTPGRGIRNLSVAAVDGCLTDAGVPAEDVDRVFFGNAAAGTVETQDMIRGQVALRHHALGGKPLINVENACASGGSAINLAYESVAAGFADVAMAIGAEQLNHEDRSRPFNALRGSTDINEIGESVPGEMASNSILMEFYAGEAQAYLDDHGADPSDFARVAVKNRNNAVHNPLAHFRTPQTLEEVLGARMIVPPLTLPMCSPTTDGAAALLFVSEAYAKRMNLNGGAIEVLTSKIAPTKDGQSPVPDAASKAYAAASLGPDDLDLVELHDAAAPAELLQYAEIGLCEEGQAHHILRAGETELGGRIPVNASGGLLSRGHPLGATGTAQVSELVFQLRGRADGRQVAGARTAMAVNGGGWLNGTYATTVVTILQKAS